MLSDPEKGVENTSPDSPKNKFADALYPDMLDILVKQIPGDIKYQRADTLVSIDKLRRQFEIYREDVVRWWQLPRREINEIVLDAITVYNEFISDAFMCASFELSYIGYIYALVRITNRTNVSGSDTLQHRRMQLSILSIPDTPPLDNTDDDSELANSLRVFFNNQLLKLKDDIETILESQKPDNLDRDIQSVGDRLYRKALGKIDLPEYLNKNFYNSFPSLKSIRKKEEEFLISKCISRFADLCSVAESFEEILKLPQPESDVLDHIKTIYKRYQRIKQEQITSMEESRTVPFQVRKKISDYYNGNLDGHDFSPRAMLDDAVMIINEYYYRNRFNVAKLDLEKKEFILD